MQERSAPRRSFNGHTLTTPWDKLHELYFVSYAFLNYLSTPFLFAEPDLKSRRATRTSVPGRNGAGCM
jgi:hypothetical protein